MIEFVQDAEGLVCAFEGSLNTAACNEIEAQVYGKVDEASGAVVFDLSRVDYVSSGFIRICLSVHKRAGEGGFKITNPQPAVKRVFMISGLSGLLG